MRARCLWIYRGDITDAGDAQPGELVRIADPRGRVIGRALYSSRSQIALRVIAFDDIEIDRPFWRARLDAAAKLRDAVISDATAFRLVYGESDLLPSLIVDRFADCFVIQTLSQGMDALKPLWIDLLAEMFNPRAIVERNDARVRLLEGLPLTAGILNGVDPGDLEVSEGAVRFIVNLIEGQKTGAFLDQRENRVAAGHYARGRALDCFTFQGGFALHLAQKAAEVTAVDVSGAALTRARRNAKLNGAPQIEFIEANVFDLLREMEQRGQRFDVINLDPPAFAKNKASAPGAARGYKEINLRAMKMLNPGGVLITSTCSFHMSEDAFLNCIVEAAADAGRSARIIEKRTQARDHPILISMPETYYLKCLILQLD